MKFFKEMSVPTGRPRNPHKNDNSKSKSDLDTSETSYASYSSYNPQVITLPNIVQFNGLPNIFSQQQNLSCNMAPPQCQKSRYRTFDGTCNNLYQPMLGMANSRYGRLVPASYGDGIRSPRTSITGHDLPLSRLLSFVLFPEVDLDDIKHTLVAMQWGQIITHDMGLASGATQSKPHAIQCCTQDGQLVDNGLKMPRCYPMLVPQNDPAYSKYFVQCLNFVRTMTDLDLGCLSSQQAAEQLNAVTHFMDLSPVYGSDDVTAFNLRARIGGRLNADIRRNQEWPPAANNASAMCDIDFQNQVCYQAGDIRVNQNPQLTVLQVLLLREHNRIAGLLSHINPHWNDETIYQETRRIVIAEYQHISYYEWMPIFLGLSNMIQNKLIYKTNDYVNDYNPSVDPSTLNDHSHAAFRFFHTNIAGFLNLVNHQRTSFGALRLSDFFNRPGILEQGNNFPDLVRGLSYQPQRAADQFQDREITQNLFRPSNRPIGSDLLATDIQRGRDHGLASYNAYRQYCGLPRASKFSDFNDWISIQNVNTLAQLYHHPDDVDLMVGASLENLQPGALVGPTFLCILTEQFYRTRVGDRFWYETPSHDVAFTIEQLNEIRKASISRLFCDNEDNVTVMQPRGFMKVSNGNPLVNCESLPQMDLTQWKDYAIEIGNNQQGFRHIPSFKKK